MKLYHFYPHFFLGCQHGCASHGHAGRQLDAEARPQRLSLRRLRHPRGRRRLHRHHRGQRPRCHQALPSVWLAQGKTIQFIRWSQMHAQPSFLNGCNTAMLGYHGDKIILYKKCQKYQICQKSQVIATFKYVKITDYLTIKHVNITDNSTITFGWNNFQNFGL